MRTWLLEAVIMLQGYTMPLTVTVLEPPGGRPSALPIPSLLGRDILSRFALFVEERTDRVLLLEPHEADALTLPH